MRAFYLWNNVLFKTVGHTKHALWRLHFGIKETVKGKPCIKTTSIKLPEKENKWHYLQTMEEATYLLYVGFSVYICNWHYISIFVHSEFKTGHSRQDALKWSYICIFLHSLYDSVSIYLWSRVFWVKMANVACPSNVGQSKNQADLVSTYSKPA